MAVTFEKNAIILRIEKVLVRYEDLYNLQRALIRLLMQRNEDECYTSEDYYIYELLESILLTEDDFKALKSKQN